MFGGGVLSTVFKFAGRYLGNYITESSYLPDETYSFSHHLDDIITHPSNIPYIIPIIFGKARIRGRLIWSLNLKESAFADTKSKFFRDTHSVKSKHHHTNYEYSADFALALAEGEISDIGRIWINGVISNISQYKYRFYRGDEDQKPDPLILKYEEEAPAFRNLSYIIFEDFPLKEFGNKIPIFEFELIRNPSITISNLVKNICIIPGSGEFIYDTEIVEKNYYARVGGDLIGKEYINCHNNQSQADSLYNLESLTQNFQNLESISLVVTWFVDSLDAASADIYPAIESSEINSSIDWRVAEFTRENAKIVSSDSYGNPNYVGTVNDTSIVRYLVELKKRNIKIMFNPMIFLDIENKPWRGHISGNRIGIREFFKKYRKFILHYANLTKDYIDSFLIGSELKGLTGFREDNKHPAVEELIILAAEVKKIVGDSIKISYCADWSEYHHKDGYYNLDSLWADKNIDFIGIDAYFPLTASIISDISIEEIKKGFESGEGFDFYFEHNKKKTLDSPWAWKNIRYWWENEHYNSDGTKTSWIPRSKKIYFTEFGFPSIDKAPNQPNIFYDPNSIDGGIPKYSSGEVDFEIQRKGIRAFLEYWQDSEMVEKSFLWAWDARPQPAWPHLKIWRDSNLWLKGHWVNDKLNYTNLTDILKELCIRSGYREDEIIVKSISQQIDGFVLQQDTSALDTILMLQSLYFFDIKTNELGQIEFISREGNILKEIPPQDLVKDNNLFEIDNITINNSISHIRLSYISYLSNYKPEYVEIFDENKSYKEVIDLKIPILMNAQNARIISKKIIDSRKYENQKIKLILPCLYIEKIDIGYELSLEYNSSKFKMRVSSIKYENYKCYIEATST